MSVRDLSRKRFGVESSYRQLGQVRPRTSTANGVVRLLWVAVGLILRNARVQFGTDRDRKWALGAVCLLLLVDILGARTASPSEPSTGDTGVTHTRSPT